MSYIGTTEIGKMFLGTTEIDKAYLGSELVFSSGGAPTPPPYTLLNYIQTDGTAYIDTGINGNQPKSFLYRVKLNSSISASEAIAGCGNSDGSTATFMPGYRSSSRTGYLGLGYYSLYTSGMVSISSLVSNEFDVECVLKQGSGTYIGAKATDSQSYTTVSKSVNRNIATGRSMFLFCSNNAGSPARMMANGERIYFFKIYNSSDYTNLVFDGVPVLYNGEYGLWDLVSNSFKGNAAGSGAFTGA